MRALITWSAGALVAVGSLTSCGVGEPQPPAAAQSVGGATTATTTTSAAAAPSVSEPAPPDTVVAPTQPDTVVAPTQPARVANSPDALADQLVTAERAIRDPATPEGRLARQAQRQQVGYRVLALHPEWVDRVVGALPTDLRDDALGQVAARQEFIAMQSQLADGPPDWQVTAPPSADDLLRWYRGAERTYGVDWEVLAAVNLVETAMGRIQSDSVAGAQGPMQFLPSTWARWGRGDIHDPYHAIYAAARYLAANGAADGDLDTALFRYNNDNGYVRGVKRYADVMRHDPDTFRGFYHWQVYYRTTAGDLLLPEGYPALPAVAR